MSEIIPHSFTRTKARQGTTTPPPKPTVIQTTPNSYHSSSHSSSLAVVNKVVDEVNKYLADNLSGIKTLTPEQFAIIILGLEHKKLRSAVGTELMGKLEAYLLTTLYPGDEPVLYPSAVDLFNSAATDSNTKEHAKLFLIQDDIPVRGSFVKQKPDLCGAFRSLVEKFDVKSDKLAGWMYWALILYVVEIKHQKGYMLERKYELPSTGE